MFTVVLSRIFEHLWVLESLFSSGEKILMVNISSMKENSQQTVGSPEHQSFHQASSHAVDSSRSFIRSIKRWS